MTSAEDLETNLGVRTLVKYATALGGRLTLKIDITSPGAKSSHRATQG